MDQNNRNHEIRTPSVQGSNEPTQRNRVIESLEAVPCLSCRRHIDQRQQYAGNDLEHETRQRGAAEHIEPARGLTRNWMLGRLANRSAKLQPQIEPLAQFLDQAHVVSPCFVFAARPGVGISPALMRSFPFSSL